MFLQLLESPWISGRFKAAAEALAMQAAQLGVAPHELAAATADQVLDDDDLIDEPDDEEADALTTVAA